MVEKKSKKPARPAKKAAAPAKKVAAKRTAPSRAAAAKPAPPEAPAPAAPARKRAPKARPAPEAPRPAPVLGPHDLSPAAGSTHYRKRVGRGPGSGHGKTAGKGNKGQKSRTGYRHLRGFEGGQMPLHRRVPKRGFTNIFRVEYDVVNLSALGRFKEGVVTPDDLADARLSRRNRPVKILGDGEIAKALNVSAHKFSASARAKIEAAGGRCEVIPR